MSAEAQHRLTGNLERWQSFLKTASQLYKYPYHEQVMIYGTGADDPLNVQIENLAISLSQEYWDNNK